VSRALPVWAAGVVALLCLWAGPSRAGETLRQQNEELFHRLRQVHGLSDGQMKKIREIFARSGYIGQGNPSISEHPASPEACEEKLARESISYENPEFEKVCGRPFMAPLYDPSTERPEEAEACIDQFEFPDIPCEYPVVWVRAREAEELCEAEGKRLCDAHEWEGGCEGRLEPPDYRFDLAQGVSPEEGIRRMRQAHNQLYGKHPTWSYGPEYRTGVCGTSSHKSPGCDGGGWSKCGSNTFPTGYFPDCRSPLGVYDLNGNAAEHMNLPLDPSQMASRGSVELGYTEMKGSWFIFDTYRAHEDWCRWRAPFWHGSRVMDPKSHENYHLGFRCCKTVDPRSGESSREAPQGKGSPAGQ
jgi:formylglycine-generating enzyme required for sulfatase activity